MIIQKLSFWIQMRYFSERNASSSELFIRLGSGICTVVRAEQNLHVYWMTGVKWRAVIRYGQPCILDSNFGLISVWSRVPLVDQLGKQPIVDISSYMEKIMDRDRDGYWWSILSINEALVFIMVILIKNERYDTCKLFKFVNSAVIQ